MQRFGSRSPERGASAADGEERSRSRSPRRERNGDAEIIELFPNRSRKQAARLGEQGPGHDDKLLRDIDAEELEV